MFGWNVTDCKICFEYGLYYSPVSTPADFRSLAPIVLEQALKESGTQLLEPYLSFTLYAPREYLSRAYHDAPKYCATIETVQVKKDEVVFTGEIPPAVYRHTVLIWPFTPTAERMPYRAERISGRCRSAGHPAPPSKQPPGQGAPYVSEGNVKIHNRQDGNNQKLWRVTMEYSKEDLMEAKKQIWGVGENMGTEESKKIWEENAQFWDNAMGDESNEFHREVVRPKVTELLSPNPADYILDIACGNGNYSSYLAQRGASVVAFDYSKKMIELAKRRQSQYAKTN